jgi:hypothetical protein
VVPHSSGFRLPQGGNRPFRLTLVPEPRLEIRTFSNLAGDVLKSFLQTAEELRSEPAVIVDLRGNRGGSDLFAKQWFAALLGEAPKGWEIRELLSPVTLQGDVLLHRWLLERASSPYAREQAGGRLAYFQQRLRVAEEAGIERHWKTPDEGTRAGSAMPENSGLSAESLDRSGGVSSQRGFAGRLIVLVDRGTCSSAETFVLMAKRLPGTVLLGENTGGMAEFGEIKLYTLPHSGIQAQVGSKKFQDTSGAFAEGLGFKPDYWLDSSHPISSILEEIGALGTAGSTGEGTGSKEGSGISTGG